MGFARLNGFAGRSRPFEFNGLESKPPELTTFDELGTLIPGGARRCSTVLDGTGSDFPKQMRIPVPSQLDSSTVAPRAGTLESDARIVTLTGNWRTTGRSSP
jgi:hypothetical protein